MPFIFIPKLFLVCLFFKFPENILDLLIGCRTVLFYLLYEIPIFSSIILSIASVAPIASMVTVLPVISRISSSFGIAVISFVFSGIGICAITRLVAASMAFKMYGAFLSFIFSVAALSAFPSITICIPLILKILPIQSVNARDSSSSSIPQAILENVESDGMPFFNVRYFSVFPDSILPILRYAAERFSLPETLRL